MAEAVDEVDIKALQGKQDKIKELMRRDPKFIARLISVSKPCCVQMTCVSHTHATLSSCACMASAV
jgi:hypothetical protein